MIFLDLFLLYKKNTENKTIWKYKMNYNIKQLLYKTFKQIEIIKDKIITTASLFFPKF